MSDKHSGISKRHLVLTVLISAAVSTLFGFMAGIISSNKHIRGQMLAGISPALQAYFDDAKEGDENKEAAAAPVTTDGMTEEEKLIAVVEKSSPAVVSIVVSKDMPTYEQYYANPFGDNELFRQFFDNNPAFGIPQYRQNGTERREIGAGSGFIVSADGFVVTNKHVVSDEDAGYVVIAQDGTKYDAQVLGRDPSNDIAVLKIERGEGPEFPFLPYGDASNLKVGQKAIAIGYALGRFGNSVSTGIVSGLERRIEAGDGWNRPEELFGVIQTDAAINPGNSGGPLLNLRGEVIGVNVAIVQGSQNIGFALPINDVRMVVESVQKGGKISRAFLGVRYVMVSKALKEKNQLPVDYGALVGRGPQPDELAVMPGSPADVAGIVENDIILEVDGKKVTEDYPLFAAIAKKAVGDKVSLKVLSKGKEKIVEVTLGERK